jgi:hypothetical protein
MRVLVVTNMYPTETMPAFGTFVYEQVESLRRKGLEIDVLFVNGKENTWNYARGLFQVLRQARAVRYDLVHAHYVFAGVLARAQLRYPLVVTFHGAGEMAGWVGWLCRALAPLTDACTVTSAAHAAELGYRAAHIVPLWHRSGTVPPAADGSSTPAAWLAAGHKAGALCRRSAPGKAH